MIDLDENETDIFQFHIGSIRRAVGGGALQGGIEFQFHIGSIRRPYLENGEGEEVLYFNSTLVRLEVAPEPTKNQ